MQERNLYSYTLIISTLEMQQAYEPLIEFYVNVFAFDFLGTGKSGGKERDFSRASIVKYMDAVVEYIKWNSINCLYSVAD